MISLLQYIGRKFIDGLAKILTKDVSAMAKANAGEVKWLRTELKSSQESLIAMQKDNQEIREALKVQLQEATNKISNMKSTVHGLQSKVSKQRRHIEELDAEVKSLRIVNESQNTTIRELKKLVGNR
jgi:peptidoglycan hydrolase CwlO-like protein